MTEMEMRELIEGVDAGDYELEASELMPWDRVVLELVEWPRDEL